MTPVKHPPIAALCIVCDQPMRSRRGLVCGDAGCRRRAELVARNILYPRLCEWCGDPLDKTLPRVTVTCSKVCRKRRHRVLSGDLPLVECPRCGTLDAYAVNAAEVSCLTCGYYTIGGHQAADIIGMVTPRKKFEITKTTAVLRELGYERLTPAQVIGDNGGALGRRWERLERADRQGQDLH